MKPCKSIPIGVQEWIDVVEGEKQRTCEEQKKLVNYIKRIFAKEELLFDEERFDKYLSLAKYFPFDNIFPWQKFCLALHLCTFRTDGFPRWSDNLIYIGRGGGKDGYAALVSISAVSEYNGIPKYDVDICANNLDQAVRPVQDVIESLEEPSQVKKLKHYFYWTKQGVLCKATKSRIRGHTNNAKGKDGLRSGMIILNEIHAYEDYNNIKVFTTGLGKVPHPRRLYIGSDGDVREGIIDDLKAQAMEILNGENDDADLLPFICRLDSDEEVHDENNWEKAVPSLPYLPNLRAETRKEYKEWKDKPYMNSDFMTKRMNRPQQATEEFVTEWENIKATEKELPDLKGRACVMGLDFAKSTDMVSVNTHFLFEDEKRADLNHSWFCINSRDYPRIKAPFKEWAAHGHITLVDDAEIPFSLIEQHIHEIKSKHNVIGIAIDSFRYSFVSAMLERLGFSKERKNLYLVRPSDIMKVVPIIDSAFTRGLFYWGDNPPLRWATNNTKLVPQRKIKGQEQDYGNFVYGKIEAKSRKTDPFMSLVASMTIENKLQPYSTSGGDFEPLPTLVF